MNTSVAKGSRDLSRCRFAVSGASGFIGRHLVRLLEQAGAEVVTLRRPASPAAFPAAKRSVVIDLSDVSACAVSLRKLQPTHIIHLAGYANSDRSVDSIAKSLNMNLNASLNLVLGAMDSVINARIGMVYGPDDPNEHRLVPLVIRAFMNDQGPVLSSGQHRCDWIHVSDVAEALLCLALQPRETASSVDVGTGLLTSIREVVQLISDATRATVAPVYSDGLDRPNEQERAANTHATFAATGWRAQIDLAEGLKQTVDWHRGATVAVSDASTSR